MQSMESAGPIAAPHASKEKIVPIVSSNLCRCMKYKSIVEAVEAVAFKE